MSSIQAAVGRAARNAVKDVTTVQCHLRRHSAWLSGPGPELTGKCDAATLDAIVTFQKEAASLAAPDGVVAPNSFTLVRLEMREIPKPKSRIFLPVCWHRPEGGISDADYEAAATVLACSAAAIRAVAETETKRAAWEDVGRPTILFERHYFSKLTDRAYDHTHPDISNQVSGGYGLYREQYGKLTRAAVLDEEAALQSASWGSFQIMGANYASAGFGSVADFVDAMIASQAKHLDAFVAFIRASPGMLKAIQGRDWAAFAKLYNGANYRKNEYDSKLAEAYSKLAPPPATATPGRR